MELGGYSSCSKQPVTEPLESIFYFLNFLNIHFNNILLSTPQLSKWFASGFPAKTVYINLSFTMGIPFDARHSLSFNDPRGTWVRVQVTKLMIM
jgi:hypothetical protein